ncbi:MAG: GTPase ObgE [Deltaproteobacteria bacterium]|nr:GTPase ObgE [Deltaproteobacteria bacterium]
MRFVDEAKILVKGGDGGNGCRSFRREAHEPHGGPDGGDGGKGGDIILLSDTQASTLADFRFRRSFEAARGEHGRGKDQNGKSGEDLIIKVPTGTLIKDENDEVIIDLSTPGTSFVIAKGGRGGRGNIRFKSSVNRAPRRADPGEPGEEKAIHLELKLLADVGLIGKPNAGKSTFLSTISRARPKIADYPFTTLSPVLGVVQPFEFRSNEEDFTFTVADIPGLIEGAHEGVGLGHQFLKHVERTKVFLHLIDASSEEDPLKAYQEIRKELEAYDRSFKKRVEWVVLTKIDLLNDASALRKMIKKFEAKKKKVFAISSATRKGVQELIVKLIPLMKKSKTS